MAHFFKAPWPHPRVLQMNFVTIRGCDVIIVVMMLFSSNSRLVNNIISIINYIMI